jgi:hypothetical protein
MSTAPGDETTALPTFHEAEPASGATGSVLYGPEIDFATALARRQSG